MNVFERFLERKGLFGNWTYFEPMVRHTFLSHDIYPYYKYKNQNGMYGITFIEYAIPKNNSTQLISLTILKSVFKNGQRYIFIDESIPKITYLKPTEKDLEYIENISEEDLDVLFKLEKL